MNNFLGVKIILPALVLAMATTTPLFAQEDNGPASQSMHRAGQSAENAASDTGQAVEHAYHGTVTAVSDTAITVKVKHALHDNKITNSSDLHVHTVAGVVTLTGTVPSPDVSTTAEQIAQETEGVKEVRNEIKMSPTATQ
jgi:hyperosmotically inducible periplasmic protein